MPTSDEFEDARNLQKRRAWNSGDYSSEKLEKFCRETGEDEAYVRDQINKNKLLRWFFLRDPIRQNIHEKTMMGFLHGIKVISNLKKLHTNELYIIGGDVIAKKAMGKMKPNCKSIDFYWECKGKKFYAYHKYTKASGGHQDNQYKDLKMFIEEANRVGNSNQIFIAIADGEFYNTMDGKAKVTKIQRLKELANEKNVFAMKSTELVEYLEICTDD